MTVNLKTVYVQCAKKIAEPENWLRGPEHDNWSISGSLETGSIASSLIQYPPDLSDTKKNRPSFTAISFSPPSPHIKNAEHFSGFTALGPDTY